MPEEKNEGKLFFQFSNVILLTFISKFLIESWIKSYLLKNDLVDL